MKLTFPRLSRPLKVGGCLLLLSPFVMLLFCQIWYAQDLSIETSCMSNQKDLGLCILMYAQDYDECMPPAAKWVDATYRYSRNDYTYECPKIHKNEKAGYGYAYNSLLSNKLTADFHHPDTTPLLFDSDWLWRNAHGPGLTSLASPPRHGNVNEAAFLDGHVSRIDSQGQIIKRSY